MEMGTYGTVLTLRTEPASAAMLSRRSVRIEQAARSPCLHVSWLKVALTVSLFHLVDLVNVLVENVTRRLINLNDLERRPGLGVRPVIR